MADENERTILEACRAALGVTDTHFDADIEDAIAAAMIKMQLGGVRRAKARDASDSLVRMAIKTYVCGTVGLDNPDAERYLASFESMVTQMKLTSDYGDYDEEVDDGSVA